MLKNIVYHNINILPEKLLKNINPSTVHVTTNTDKW